MKLNEAKKRMEEGWYLTNRKISPSGKVITIKDGLCLIGDDGESTYLIPWNLVEQIDDSWHFCERVLTTSECDYLEHALKPWKDDIYYVRKKTWGNTACIEVCFTDGETFRFPNWNTEYKIMYDNMIPNRHYAPKRLGLWMPEEETEK